MDAWIMEHIYVDTYGTEVISGIDRVARRWQHTRIFPEDAEITLNLVALVSVLKTM